MANDLTTESLVIPGRGPTPRVYDAVVALLTNAQKEITANPEAGTVSTELFTAAKGEVRLKIEVGISGNYVRVEVWHDTGWTLTSPKKTQWSRRIEEKYTKLINTMIKKEKYMPLSIELFCETSSGPVLEAASPGEDLQFNVVSSQEMFGYFFSSNSSGHPM